MRVIGFSEEWAKLQLDVTQTVRFPRADDDWQVGETVQVVLKPRGPTRRPLGLAIITTKDLLWVVTRAEEPLLHPGIRNNPLWDTVPFVTELQARRDGFEDVAAMVAWFTETHGDRRFMEPANVLELQWLHRVGQPASVFLGWPETTS